MRNLRAWLLRLAASLFPLRRRRDADLADELETHLAMHVEENVRRGMPPQEARRQAILHLGGLDQAKERYRDRVRLPWLDSLFADLRYAARTLRRNRGFTIALILILALGIGGTTAMYTVVYGVMLRPLPLPHSEQLMGINGITTPAEIDPVQYWGHNPAFDDIAFFYPGGANLRTHNRTERVAAAVVSYSFFQVLEVRPALGQVFLGQDGPAFPRVAVLSYSLWARRFGKDRSIAGKTVLINNFPYTILGVMPASFHFPQGVEIWMPDADRSGRAPIVLGSMPSGISPVNVPFGRLKPGVAIAQAGAIMTTLAHRLQSQYGNAHRVAANPFVTVEPLQKDIAGDVQAALLLLLGAVGFVLLIACANAANMLLARAAVRQKEIALRLCLGATRLRVLRQLLTESVLLALIGGGFGVLFARWFVGVIRALAPADIPRMADVAIDPRVLGVALAISSIAGIVVGLAPAIQSLAPELVPSLKMEGQRSMGRLPRFLRGALVVCEVALSLVLVSGAGLMLQSLNRMTQTRLQFNPKNVLTMGLDLPRPDPSNAGSSPASTTAKSAAEQKRAAGQAAEGRRAAQAALERFHQDLLERVRRIPGVLSAATVSALPFTGRWGGWFVYPQGKQFKDGGMGQIVVVSGDYFRTMGVSLVAGRTFTKEEQLSGADVVILGENLARGLWPHSNPIGRRLMIERSPKDTAMEIVGVAPELTESFTPQQMRVPVGEMYFPGGDNGLGTLVARTAPDPKSMIAPVSEAVLALDPDLTAYNARTMEDVISSAMGPQRFRALILGFFAVTALVLAVLGVYGVMAYFVSCRTHEIGVRMALGAGKGGILRLILTSGMRLAFIGVALGLALAFALNRIMASLLFGTSPTEPLALIAAAGLLIIGAFAACCIPARRAMRVDPMTALRYE